MDELALQIIWNGGSLQFTFRHEAIQFAEQNKLAYKFVEADLINDEHIEIIGYNAQLYWISR